MIDGSRQSGEQTLGDALALVPARVGDGRSEGPGNALPPIDRRVTVATPRYGFLVGRAATVRNTDGVRARKRSGPLIVESRCGTFRRYVIPEGAVHTVGGAKTIRDALGSTHGTGRGSRVLAEDRRPVCRKARARLRA